MNQIIVAYDTYKKHNNKLPTALHISMSNWSELMVKPDVQMLFDPISKYEDIHTEAQTMNRLRMGSILGMQVYAYLVNDPALFYVD